MCVFEPAETVNIDSTLYILQLWHFWYRAVSENIEIYILQALDKVPQHSVHDFWFLLWMLGPGTAAQR